VFFRGGNGPHIHSPNTILRFLPQLMLSLRNRKRCRTKRLGSQLPTAHPQQHPRPQQRPQHCRQPPVVSVAAVQQGSIKAPNTLQKHPGCMVVFHPVWQRGATHVVPAAARRMAIAMASKGKLPKVGSTASGARRGHQHRERERESVCVCMYVHVLGMGF